MRISLKTLTRSGALMLCALSAERVNAQTADFTLDKPSGCASHLVQFTDNSAGNIVSYLWDFGNGNSSSLQNPATLYSIAGTYPVKLVVTDNLGNKDSITKVNAVTVFSSPRAGFLRSDTLVCPRTAIFFTDTSIVGNDSITSWFWDFGDGNSSVQQYPSHVYSIGGSFSVSLQISDKNGCKDAVIVDNAIRVFRNPDADFSISGFNPCVLPSPVSFTEATLNPDSIPLSFTWYFGTGDSSASQNPNYSYIANGDYTVTLIVSSYKGCIDTLVKDDFIKIRAVQAQFNNSTTTGCSPFTVNFTDQSSGLDTLPVFRWNFGDAGVSFLQNPSHNYTNAGTYTVTLIAANGSGCSDTISKVGLVTINAGTPFDFLASDSIGCSAPFTISFSYSGPGGVSSYAWDFGDGTQSVSATPSKTYSLKGVYPVSLTVTDANGCISNKVKTAYIRVGTIETGFSPNPLGGCIPLAVRFTDSSKSPYTINSYRWFFGTGDSSSAANPTYTYADTGKFAVMLIASDAAGCSDTFIFNPIRAGIKPQASFDIFAKSGCMDDFYARFVNTSPNVPVAPDSFLWDFGDNKFSTGRDPVHQYDTDPGQYTVTLFAFNNGCSDTFSKDSIFVLGPSSAIRIIDDSCRDTDSVEFISVSLGNPTSQEWYLDGIFQSSATSFKRFLTPAVYNVMLVTHSTNTGCTDSSDRTFTIRTTFMAGFTINPNVCINELLNPMDTTKYAADWKWYIDGNIYTGQNPAVSVPNPGTYPVALKVTADNLCSDSIFRANAFTATGPTASVSATPSEFCFPGSVLLSGVVNSGTVAERKWFIGSNDSFTVSTDTNTYNFTHFFAGANKGVPVVLRVTDPSGCFSLDTQLVYLSKVSAKVSITAGILNCKDADYVISHIADSSFSKYALRYEWQVNGVTQADQDSAFDFQNVPDGNYNVFLRVTENNLNCTDTASVNIVLANKNMKANFAISDSFANCPPLNTRLWDSSEVQNANIVSREWFFSDGSFSVEDTPVKTFFYPGIYDVKYIIRDAQGCADSITKVGLIEVRGPKGSLDFTIHAGCTPLIVNFSTDADTSYDITWDPGNGDVQKGNTITTAYTVQGNYRPSLLLIDSSGCNVLYTADSTINVSETPDPNFKFRGACKDSLIRFENTSTTISGGAVTFVWNFGDGNTSTADTPNYAYSAAGTYTVILEAIGSGGCSDDTAIQIRINAVNADFSIISDTICAGDTLEIINNSTGDTTLVSYLWNFGEGSTDTGENPVKVYGTGGSYRVGVMVWDAMGCTDSFVFPSMILVNDTVPPPLVAMYRTTVNSGSETQTEWKPAHFAGFTGYELYKWTGNSFTSTPVLLNDVNDTVFTDNNVFTGSFNYSYYLVANSWCRQNGFLDTAKKHTTVLLSLTQGQGAVTLDWTLYKGWQNVQRYEIYRKLRSAANYGLLATVSNTTISYADSTAQCDYFYEYYIRAIEDSGNLTVSLSNIVEGRPVYTPVFVVPEVIRATVNTNREIQVDYTAQVNQRIPLTRIIIQRGIQGVGFTDFAVIDTANCCASFIDNNVNAGGSSYAYRIAGENACGTRSNYSNIGKTILLNAYQNNDDKPQMYWSPYAYWNSGIDRYEVEFMDVSGAPALIATVSANAALDATDSSTNASDADSSCYRVKAIKSPPGNPGITSYSNISCVTGKSSLFIPNAFTPGRDALNSVFQITGSHIREFEIVIFNRWGEFVFQSNDINNSWDGTFRDEAMPSDVYMYMLNAVGYDGKFHRSTGVIHLIR